MLEKLKSKFTIDVVKSIIIITISSIFVGRLVEYEVVGIVMNAVLIYLIIRFIKSRILFFILILLSMLISIISAVCFNYVKTYFNYTMDYTQETKFEDYELYHSKILEKCVPLVKCSMNVKHYYNLIKEYSKIKKQCVYKKIYNCDNKVIYLNATIFLYYYAINPQSLSLSDKLNILELLTRDEYIWKEKGHMLPYHKKYIETIKHLYSAYLKEYKVSVNNAKLDDVVKLRIIQKRLEFLI